MKVRTARLFVLAIFFSMLAIVPAWADSTLFCSGLCSAPANGTLNAYNISTYAVSDQFTVPASSSIESLTIWYWTQSQAFPLTSVDMAISSTPLPSTGFETLYPNTNDYLGVNTYDWFVYTATFSFDNIDWSGSGWITLTDANSGNSVILWDVNATTDNAVNSYGVGGGGTVIPSESFSLDGTIVPEPSSLILLGSGLLGLAGMLRRKLAR